MVAPCSRTRSTPSTAPAGAAAATGVEQHVLLAGVAQHGGEIALRLVDDEARGARPGLLVAVGVADQHALAAPVRLEVTAVERVGEQLLHGGAAGGERLGSLELRGDVERDLAGALVVDLRPAGEQQRREHVVGTGGAAHDEITDRVRAIAMPALDDGVEHREGAPSEGTELGDRSAILLERLRQQLAALAALAQRPARVI